MNINSLLMLEKRISQISSKIEVLFSFDIIKTKHAEEREDFSKRGLNTNHRGNISNAEMSELVHMYRDEISRKIATGEIINETEFVIRNLDRQLAMAVVVKEISINYWQLIIKTVFRATEDEPFRAGKDQIVFE